MKHQSLRRIKVWTSITVVVVFITVIIVNRKLSFKYKWEKSLPELTYHYFDTQSSASESKACVIPSLNPFSPEVLKFLKNHSMKCSIKQYGKITKDGFYLLRPSNKNNITEVKVSYIYRHNPRNRYVNNDFGVKFSDPVYLKRNNKGELEENLPETRRGRTRVGTCDQFNLIFKDLHKAGYVTMYSEDTPTTNSFNYRLNGFNKPPTSWYLRPYWLAQIGSPKCDVEFNLKFLRTFIETYEDTPKLSLTIHGDIGHNDFNLLQVIDNDILKMIDFFKSPVRINHTIFIIFGDHGSRAGSFRTTTQGKLEERLPFFSMTLPPSFKNKYLQMFTALKNNADLLTNHFDIYATLQHLLSYPSLPNMKFIGQSLFTEIDPARTCQSSGVKEHWCPCLVYKNIPVTDEKVKDLTQKIVSYINSLINNNNKAKGLCANLTLLNITTAALMTPKNEVTRFKNTKVSKDCDSCEVVYDNSLVSKQYYEIVFTVNPSGATYEASADVLPDLTAFVDPNISRLNFYGNQSHCIVNEFPYLRPYCYCLQQ